ncbi:MAG TPA: Ig-like domain-containing protein, partial [Anaerolineales bacterium]|nr:Ig-like domain-containing protein [Anaerolineales bacterium]
MKSIPKKGQCRQPQRGIRRGRVFAALTPFLALIVLSACVGLEWIRPEATATPSVPDSGLPVVDDGAPLPPQVIEQRPAIGESLPLTGEIELVFDQEVDPVKMAAALRMEGPDGAAIPGEITWPDKRTLRFEPEGLLEKETAYRVILGTGAASAQGVSMAEPLELLFSTAGELRVSQTFPSDGTADVVNNAVITAIFNRPVVPLVVAEQRDTLPAPLEISPPVSGQGEWVSTSVYAFRPGSPLKGGTSYTVTIKRGLFDAAQETQLADNFTWDFKIITPSIQSLELSSGLLDPEDYAENILLDETFTFTFFQPMDAGSTKAALSLTPSGGFPVSLKTAWNNDRTRLTITPSERLALDTIYVLRMEDSAQSADGGQLDRAFSWTFTTIPAPSVVYFSPSEEYPPQGYSSELHISFASPMRLDTVKSRIVISPEPEGEIQWWYNDYDWSLNAYILEPSTRYVVRALPGMQDIYGNTTSREYTARFKTDAEYPQAGLQMPYQPAIIRADGPQQFYVTYRNVTNVRVQLYQIDARQFASFQGGGASQYEYMPPADDLIWETKLRNSGKLNERVLKPLEPVGLDGGKLAPGFYFLGLDSPDITNRPTPFLDTRILVVVGANLTFKTTTNEALIWVTDLTSGQPLSGVPMTVYDKRFRAVGQGVSDQDGLLLLDVPTPYEPYEPRYVMTDGDQPFGFASGDWGSGTNLYDYGLWSSYYAPGNQPKVYVYTDRPIYRPNQPVYFKGILWLDDDLAYGRPAQKTVHVSINTYKETIYEADLPLSPLGTFDGQITLDPEAALGSYSINVRMPGKTESVIGVGFTVAEYRKPEFQVKVEAAPTSVLSGQDYSVTVSADYYSGGGVGDALVEWTLSSRAYTFTPSDEFSGYSFADDEGDVGYYFDEFGPPETEIIADGQGRTDANGQLVVDLTADLSKSKTGREFTFEATVTDLSKNAVSGRASVIAHRSGVYPGVRPTTYVATAGERTSFDVLALDPESKPIPGQKVKVEIVERRWYSVQEQDATGRVQWKSTVEEIPVASDEVTTDARGKASTSFTPPQGGVYKARVSALDAQANQGSASAFVWVAGPDYIPWRQTNDRSFDLITDRRAYAPGDTAEILIASPFQGESYALVTVERGHIYLEEVLHLTSNSTLYKLPITPELAPNAYVSVVVVKGVDETNPRPNFKMGVIEIKVDPREQEVLVTITPDQDQAAPGEKVTYTVTARDIKGQPVDAELSLGLSDLATLSLASPNSPPILDFFYNERTLGVWTSIPIGLSLEDYNATIAERLTEGEGMGSGGGKGGGEFGVIEVRQDFPDTAFWDAHVQTGSDGQAQVTVTLPDNLTTWRMDARAVTADSKVGQAINDLISTRPLLVRPQTPRFFVVGDQVRLGAAIHNNTDQAMTVDIELQAEGLTLQGNRSQRTEIAAKRQAYVTWDAEVDPEAGRVDLIFSAQGQTTTGERLQDASRPPLGTLDNQGLPVYRYEARETVGTSGQMTSGGTRVEAISLPSAWETSEGDLTIEISPSLAAGMTDSLTYLEQFPYECVEQTVSRFLPNVITTRALKSAGLSDPELESNLESQVNAALQRLANWQYPDGGWSWWANVSQKSDPQTTSYVVLGLVEAQEAGYGISEPVLERALEYLRGEVQPAARLEGPAFLNRQAFLLYVLARAGSPDISATV